MNIKFIKPKKKYIKFTGKAMYFWDIMKIFTRLISTVAIQLVPIWILIILSRCLDVSFRINAFLENILVYNIVVGGTFLIEEKQENGNGRQHIKLLSVLIVILASVTYAGLLLTTDSIGSAGLKIKEETFLKFTVAISQFTMLIQYFGIEKDSVSGGMD
ncbi:hypothetical protein [Pseudobutyrivibrio xylanivorans]|uniref:hypothetical protein n=1 Tax=Pseudobutyrivibrio xylanivorans TaxID=185007 RepID=UPI001160C402|nr:hypothetical protein [Pseudobutyrivibrio xylanivorans]